MDFHDLSHHSIRVAGPSSQPMSSDDDCAREAMEDAAIYRRSQSQKPQKKTTREESAKEYEDDVVALCKLLGEWPSGRRKS